jgi:tripartite-type tricarboxylate transporter receptor subunit TctC
MAKTLALPEVREGLAAQGAEVFSGSPEDFSRFLAAEVENTRKVIRAARLQID